MNISTKRIPLPGNKKLGTIQNNDINNIIAAFLPEELHPEGYAKAIEHLLEGKPTILAQNVGMPDPVIYKSNVATRFDKYLVETSLNVEGWRKESDDKAIRSGAECQVNALLNMFNAGTDPLSITIETSHRHGVPVVASYRMNAEDWYNHTFELSDFGRLHPEWLIPGTGAMDYAIPGVYDQRMGIFTEIVENYDIEGIEFDFRRWYNMISNPIENHTVLTKLVRDTRSMLDRMASKKGKERMLLGVRVAPFIDGHHKMEEMPGAYYDVDVLSCSELGLDIRTWIDEELVDYVCPAAFCCFLPGLPKTSEFVKLAENKNVGIYPTMFSCPEWSQSGMITREASPAMLKILARAHRDELCHAAQQCYLDGADGISTFNFYGHLQYARNYYEPLPTDKNEGNTPPKPVYREYRYTLPHMKTELFVHRYLDSIEALKECMTKEPAIELNMEY